MTRQDILAQALELTVEERITLAGDLWESVSDVPDAIVLTESEKKLLDERLDACRHNPDAGSPWEVVKARLLKKHE